MEVQQRKEFFKITSVSRDDLKSIGFDADNLEDPVMEKIAERMKNAYLDNCFWTDLEIIAGEVMNILKLKQTEI